MKRLLQVIVAIVGITVTGMGAVMAITNPGQIDYEQYAAEELSSYLKENVCNQTQGQQEVKNLVRGYCKTLVDTGRPQIQDIIALTTKRQNFLLFSIYQTELSFPSPVPSYQFGTIGVLQNFYTYEAQEI